MSADTEKALADAKEKVSKDVAAFQAASKTRLEKLQQELDVAKAELKKADEKVAITQKNLEEAQQQLVAADAKLAKMRQELATYQAASEPEISHRSNGRSR